MRLLFAILLSTLIYRGFEYVSDLPFAILDGHVCEVVKECTGRGCKLTFRPLKPVREVNAEAVKLPEASEGPK